MRPPIIPTIRPPIRPPIRPLIIPLIKKQIRPPIISPIIPLIRPPEVREMAYYCLANIGSINARNISRICAELYLEVATVTPEAMRLAWQPQAGLPDDLWKVDSLRAMLEEWLDLKSSGQLAAGWRRRSTGGCSPTTFTHFVKCRIGSPNPTPMYCRTPDQTKIKIRSNQKSGVAL